MVMGIECEHGQLARSCNICEYEKEIAELEAENQRLREALGFIRNMNDHNFRVSHIHDVAKRALEGKE
jgi:hypothetical protein